MNDNNKHTIDCKGTIKWKEDHYDLDFQIIIGEYGDFLINFEPIILNKKTKWLLYLFSTKGQFVEHFSIFGKDNLGYKISTDSAYIAKHGIQTGANGDFLIIEATALQLSLESSKDYTNEEFNSKLKYLTVGQLGFELIQVESDVGMVGIRGASELDDYGRISGFVIIENDATKKVELETWCTKCDEIAVSVLDILSLSQGRLIRWSIRRHYINNELVSIILSGPKKTSGVRWKKWTPKVG